MVICILHDTMMATSQLMDPKTNSIVDLFVICTEIQVPTVARSVTDHLGADDDGAHVTHLQGAQLKQKSMLTLKLSWNKVRSLNFVIRTLHCVKRHLTPNKSELFHLKMIKLSLKSLSKLPAITFRS